MRRILLLFLLALPLNLQAELSEAENAVARAVEENFEAGIELLERLVNINSGTYNPSGVNRTADLLESEFKALGFSIKRVRLPTKMNRGDHLFARLEGSFGKKILIIGHMDTVFEKDHSFQEFQRPSKAEIRGPGVNDMKGGIVAVLLALKSLKETGQLEGAQIEVALMGDEESTGSPLEVSRQSLISAAQRNELALGFEYAVDSINKATIARRGFTRWYLEVKGNTGHSSKIFSKEMGMGSAYAMSAILDG